MIDVVSGLPSVFFLANEWDQKAPEAAEGVTPIRTVEDLLFPTRLSDGSAVLITSDGNADQFRAPPGYEFVRWHGQRWHECEGALFHHPTLGDRFTFNRHLNRNSPSGFELNNRTLVADEIDMIESGFPSVLALRFRRPDGWRFLMRTREGKAGFAGPFARILDVRLSGSSHDRDTAIADATLLVEQVGGKVEAVVVKVPAEDRRPGDTNTDGQSLFREAKGRDAVRLVALIDQPHGSSSPMAVFERDGKRGLAYADRGLAIAVPGLPVFDEIRAKYCGDGEVHVIGTTGGTSEIWHVRGGVQVTATRLADNLLEVGDARISGHGSGAHEPEVFWLVRNVIGPAILTAGRKLVRVVPAPLANLRFYGRAHYLVLLRDREDRLCFGRTGREVLGSSSAQATYDQPPTAVGPSFDELVETASVAYSMLANVIDEGVAHVLYVEDNNERHPDDTSNRQAKVATYLEGSWRRVSLAHAKWARTETSVVFTGQAEDGSWYVTDGPNRLSKGFNTILDIRLGFPTNLSGQPGSRRNDDVTRWSGVRNGNVHFGSAQIIRPIVS